MRRISVMIGLGIAGAIAFIANQAVIGIGCWVVAIILAGYIIYRENDYGE